jgi:hypothetical protein
MSQPRTFQFYGLAYGNSPVSITASINSTQIFSGTVNTLDQPFPNSSPSDPGILFTIDNSVALNTDFAGSLPMTLVVSGGDGIWVQEIGVNYYLGNALPAGTADGFANWCYTGNPASSEPGSSDSRSSVVINGVAQTPSRTPGNTGNFPWQIPAGQTMTHNFNIGVGAVANIAGNTQSYTGDYAAFLKH